MTSTSGAPSRDAALDQVSGYRAEKAAVIDAFSGVVAQDEVLVVRETPWLTAWRGERAVLAPHLVAGECGEPLHELEGGAPGMTEDDDVAAMKTERGERIGAEKTMLPVPEGGEHAVTCDANPSG